jgi:hypothetical protein
MSETYTLKVEAQEAGFRLDKFLSLKLTNSNIFKALERHAIK